MLSLVSLSASWTFSFISTLKFSSIYSYTSWSTSKDLYSNFGFPISFWISEINSHIFLISLCASLIASNIVSSGTSLAPASIIVILFKVPATVNVKSLFSLCSSVGFIIIFPSTNPTFTAAVGPLNGISEIAKAQAAPIIAATSGELSCSTQSTVATTTTSFLKSFGNSGLNGLSIALDVKIALSLGFPSLFKNPPGIFPTEYNFSSKSTDNGKKSIPSLGSFEAVTLTNTHVSP